MELIFSSPNWESQWIEIKKRGSPMPNDAVFLYIMGYGHYAIIPIVTQKEINALVFCHLDPSNSRPVVYGVPEIIQKDNIHKDYKSRLFMTTPSFESWKKRGYTLSVHLDTFDSKKIIPSKTKSYDGTWFPFECIITYSSVYNWVVIQEKTIEAFCKTANYIPIRDISISYIWETDYAILVIEEAPSMSSYEPIAELCLSKAYNSIRLIPGVSAVQINYLWKEEGGGGSGSGGGGPVTPPDLPSIDRSQKELVDAK